MKRLMFLAGGTVLLCVMGIFAGVMKYAGCRQSNYGASPFPSGYEWTNVFLNMGSFFPGATPTGLWIVGVNVDGSCQLEFPNPGGSYPNVTFSNQDMHEEYLSYFDSHGIKVFLQVESAFADVSTLIDLVLNKYKSHSCVIGFGIDVEWYKSSSGEGTPVSDANAQAWETKVKSHKNSYRLYLKHWESSYMPPAYRGNIIFVNDAQQLASLNTLRGTFQQWAQAFPNNTVFYQGGYAPDKTWWGGLTNPPKEIGNELLGAIGSTQEMGMFWVDFTMHDSKVKSLLFNTSINPSKLKVTVTVMNSGTVTLSPSGGEYAYNTEVTATANPGAGAKFEGWSGDISGTNATITFKVTKDMKITALFSGGTGGETDVLDNFDDGNSQNILGGYWYTYDDQIPDGGKVGKSTIVPDPLDTVKGFVMTKTGYNNSAYAAKVTYSINKGTLDEGYVGFGCQLDAKSGEIKNLSPGTGISFYHKGEACIVKVEISDVKDYAYHFASVEKHADWTLVTKNWADFKQPTDWGATVAFNAAHAVALAWEVVSVSPISGEIWIDDVRIPGMKMKPATGTDVYPLVNAEHGFSMGVVRNLLRVSSDVSVAIPVYLSIFDFRGRLQRQVYFRALPGSRSVETDISGLNNGFYTVRLKTGTRIQTGSFVLSR